MLHCLFCMTARKKATYDKFGEEGLKGGIPLEASNTGAWSSKYVYHGKPEKTFTQFFGGDNPFAGEKEDLGLCQLHKLQFVGFVCQTSKPMICRLGPAICNQEW